VTYKLKEIGDHFALHNSSLSRIIKISRDGKAKGKT
jgi:hypothetical protein